MKKVSVFSESAKKFDKVLEDDITDEVRAYCEAMKKIMTAMTSSETQMNVALYGITGKDDYVKLGLRKAKRFINWLVKE